MKKYIFIIVTILFFSGCQQALNDFNQSLAQNLNSNKSEEVQLPSTENLDTELKKFKQERVDFFKKFLVKEDESLEAINLKYQNSSNLIANAKREYNNLKAKASKLSKAYPNYDFDFTIYGYTNFLQFGMFSTRYNSYVPDELKNYINTDEYISIYNKELGDYLTTKYYQSYLKKYYDNNSEKIALQKSKEQNDNLEQKLEKYKSVRANFFKKFLVKYDATEEDFDIRFKNKEQLIKERNEIYQFLINEIKYFEKYAIENKNYSIIDKNEFRIDNSTSPTKYMITPNSENIGDFDLDDKYFKYYMDNNNKIPSYEIDTLSKYEKYLTWTKTQLKDVHSKRKANEKLIAKEKEERAKVKGACDKWLEKARKDVYSLGVGDYVVNMTRKEAGGTYIIRAVEKNTFLLYAYIWGELYGQKTDYIPESALKTAPSVYCYR